MYSYSTAAFLAAGCMGQHGGWAQTFHRLSCPNDLPEQTMRPNCPQKKRWSKQKVAPCLGGKGQTAVQGANACSNANAHEGVSLLVQKCLQCRRPGMGCVNKHLLVALRASASHVLLLSLSWQQGAWGVNSRERTPWHWSRPSWLFQKGCLSLHSWQTAILPHVGTFNSAYWAFSTFQSAFIWAIALVVLWKSFLQFSHECPFRRK